MQYIARFTFNAHKKNCISRQPWATARAQCGPLCINTFAATVDHNFSTLGHKWPAGHGLHTTDVNEQDLDLLIEEMVVRD